MRPLSSRGGGKTVIFICGFHKKKLICKHEYCIDQYPLTIKSTIVTNGGLQTMNSNKGLHSAVNSFVLIFFDNKITRSLYCLGKSAFIEQEVLFMEKTY